MSPSYFSAAIPEPFRILGLSLKPLSLGRYRLLRRFECAFVAEEEAAAGVSDLLLGGVICSMRVDEFLEKAGAASQGRLQREIRRWGRRVCPWAWISAVPLVGKWWRKHHAFDALEKMALFRRYLDEGSVVPKYWEEEGGGRSSGAHWAQSVEVVLRGELGWTAEEINEAPLSKALADYFRWAENKGLVRLMTAEEVAYVEERERDARNGEQPTASNQHPIGGDNGA